MVDKSFEYPIVEGVQPSAEISSFGVNFKEDDTAVSRFGELNPSAIRLMDRSGWKQQTTSLSYKADTTIYLN